MKRIKGLLCASTLWLLGSMNGIWARDVQSLNHDWHFVYGYQVQRNISERVDLPHTWNRFDVQGGNLNYYRGVGDYSKSIDIPSDWKDKQIYLKFYGANTIALVFVNGKFVGEHRGGYTAFAFNISSFLEYGKSNRVEVRVNNARQFDVMPQVGDFNFFGGLYRGVDLVVTHPCTISLDDSGSNGVYITPSSKGNEFLISSSILLSNYSNIDKELTLKVDFYDNDGNKVASEEQSTVLKKSSLNNKNTLQALIKKPHLWDGVNDPYRYRAVVSLFDHEKLIDQVSDRFGLRTYKVDPNKGFFLNGKHMPLHGVCRHQDRLGYGNALTLSQHKEDVDIMREMGVNAIRLAHYPQAYEIYDLMDETGIITWAEIPFVGPGGYRDKGFIDLPEFRKNGAIQLEEMIKQNYNHPSICFWGLFNELKEQGDDPSDYIEELNKEAHKLDSSRLTTAASNQSKAKMNHITDILCWNQYRGWYGGMPKDLGTWADGVHKANPNLSFGVSEYGAGASINTHEENVKKPIPTSNWHPEEWQAIYHEGNWEAINERPYLWGTFVWNMFDFGAAHRNEGDTPGINDKGLVTYDRKIKKDAFYFYKVNWNKEEPTVYITDRRYINRDSTHTQIKIYTNLKKISLWVNNSKMGDYTADKYGRVVIPNVKLSHGENDIVASTIVHNKVIKDECKWYVE